MVIQSDDFNQSRIRTVMVVLLTSNTRLAEAPGNVLLPSGETELPKDSVANVSQVATLDKETLSRKVGRVPTRSLSRIEEGLRLSLDL